MVFEKDKILINAYLDNELSEQEIIEVKKLINESAEAKQYFEALKKVNLELRAIENDDEYKEFSKKTQAFFDKEIKPQLNNNSGRVFSFLQTKIFQNIAGYTATAAVFFGIGMNLNEDQNNFLSSFDSSETVVFEYQKFRNDEPQSLESVLESALDQMLINEKLNSRIIWGGDTFFVTIKSATKPANRTTCYEVEIYEQGQPRELSYCVSEVDKSIIFNN